MKWAYFAFICGCRFTLAIPPKAKKNALKRCEKHIRD